jgi:hypothetical protein
MRSVLVVRGVQPAAGGQELDLRPLRNKSFDLVEHGDDARTLGCDSRQPDDAATVQLEFAHLGDAELKPPAQLGDQGTHHGTLLFEGVHVPEQHVEFDPADPHASIVAPPPTSHLKEFLSPRLPDRRK